MNTAQKILSVIVSLVAVSAIAGEERKLRPHFDLNGDGTVTTIELSEYRQAEFAKMDLNGDGNLSREEVTEYKAQLKAERKAKKKDRFDRADTNEDGQVSADEFAASTDKMAKRMDRNGDGTIDRREMFKAMRSHGDEGHDGEHHKGDGV
ncbi:EF-hand domain-containing protein [Zhongshania sp.]|jgi:Ca2+-binding EF-hand superfamily protein|uniref:EF-hand domain-containing protein n=1 Tax=Zhongshania sp. TaxID=1971902 RepID=UPI0039E28FBC